MSRQCAGFTLIEIMIALLIISLLAALAYPSYQQVRLKTARAEGRVALMQAMQQEERYYTLHRRYQAFSSDDDSVPFLRFSGASAQTGAYGIDAVACPEHAESCILLRATPHNGHTDAVCQVLTLDSRGVHGAAGRNAPDSPSACW